MDRTSTSTGPATITGYFTGIGSPNDYPLKWADEFLYYYTTYGTRQVLNTNPGTVLVGYLLHKLGIDNEFKISVFMGNDNPFAVLWTLIGAKMFSRPDGTSPLIGFNFSNSVNNQTIELCAEVRRELDFESVVRFEHHITETWKSIVRQPYLRRDELIELAGHVRQHLRQARRRRSRYRADARSSVGHSRLLPRQGRSDRERRSMPLLERNYLEKHNAVNRTARALTEHGLSFIAAKNLHHVATLEPCWLRLI